MTTDSNKIFLTYTYIKYIITVTSVYNYTSLINVLVGYGYT